MNSRDWKTLSSVRRRGSVDGAQAHGSGQVGASGRAPVPEGPASGTNKQGQARALHAPTRWHPRGVASGTGPLGGGQVLRPEPAGVGPVLLQKKPHREPRPFCRVRTQ